MTENLDKALKIRELAKRHTDLFRESIPLIASENIMSPLATEMLVTDLASRYAEGLPHHRYYQGNELVDQIEDLAMDYARTLFKCSQADPRPISGTNANTATIYGLTKPGDRISVPPLSGGGHISAAKFGAVGLRGLNSMDYPFDVEEMNIDVDATRKMIREFKPKVCLIGQSVYLFPTPIKEIVDTIHEVGATLWYDGAHVLGLIAGGKFQDPLHEGAEILTASTHKTFPGPQHGIILGETDSEKWKSVQRGVFPGTLSNHHLNSMAALAVTLAEELEFGQKYASEIVMNAKALGAALSAEGFNVLGEHNDYTESHTLVLDVRDQGGGKFAAEELERCNVILNKNLLPWDSSKNSQDPSGLRIGSQEVTRIGFGVSEMKEIAAIMGDLLIRKKDPQTIKRRAIELKAGFPNVKYCFGVEKAYSYFDIYREST